MGFEHIIFRLQLLRDVNDALEKGDSMQLERAVFRYKTAGISDLVTEEKILEKQHKYERIRAEVVEAAKSKDIDRQDNAIRTCVAYNLEDRGDIGMAKEMLKTLCGTGKVMTENSEVCTDILQQSTHPIVSCIVFFSFIPVCQSFIAVKTEMNVKLLPCFCFIITSAHAFSSDTMESMVEY